MSDTNVTPGSSIIIDDRFSIDALKTNYLFGLDLSSPSGSAFPEGLYYHHLNSAIEYAAGLLDVVITPQDFVEEHDYYADDFTNWGYLKLFKKPSISVSLMEVLFADRSLTQFPIDWLKLTKNNSVVRLVPNMGSVNALIITADGSLMQPFYGCSHYPQMWRIHYRAGFETLPYDLYDFIYKKAALNVIQIWYNMYYLGGSSQSLSIDGLSQSTTKPPLQIYNQYNAELKDLLNTLKSKYDSIRFTVV